MDELKRTRSSKTRTLTRRLNELNTVINVGASRIEVEEKIANAKYTFEQLGEAQVELLEVIGETQAELPACIEWYKRYDKNLHV